MLVFAITDERSSPDNPLGDAVETFIQREDAERFIEKVRGDDPELASYLRIEERELEAGGRAELAAPVPVVLVNIGQQSPARTEARQPSPCGDSSMAFGGANWDGTRMPSCELDGEDPYRPRESPIGRPAAT